MRVLHHRRDRRRPGEGRLAGEEREEEAAEGVEVGPTVDPAAEGLLRGEVLGGAHHGVGGGERLATRGLPQLGDAEVEDPEAPVGGLDDVRRLDVAVHETAGVGGLQRGRDLPGDVDDLAHRQRALPQPLGEARTGQQLHHEVGGVALDAGVVHGHDVRVAQRGGDPGLALEPGRTGLVRHPVQVDRLDRHLAPEHGVGRAPHLAHATAADRRVEDVPARESSPLRRHRSNPSALP